MLNCHVKAYGAVGDGVAPDTKAIQAAIDDCSAHGGGQVILSGGSFLSGMIRMKSGVDLHIERDAVLLGSTSGDDYPDIVTDFWRTEYAPRFNKRCFIYAEGCTDIAITGRGAIDCQGLVFMEANPEGWQKAPDNQHRAEDFYWPRNYTWPLLLGYSRKPHPVAPEGDGLVYIDGRGHDPKTVCTSPARVVFFIGCRNVLVEDVTMRNQPAGWSYWICDCADVHFHRAQVLASPEMPNNDGIHINCCCNVTVSDCNITCGDDGIVVRAYSLPLYKNTACEKVTVSGCNITSHGNGVRIAWTNDGVVRNCAFLGLNITESYAGLALYLVGNPNPQRLSDQGEEHTLIENLTFKNITMDRVYTHPVIVRICENCLCEGIRNVHFSDIHAFCAQMPVVEGRADCHVQNIGFANCHFYQMRYADMHNKFGDRYVQKGIVQNVPLFRCVDNLTLHNTVFSVV